MKLEKILQSLEILSIKGYKKTTSPIYSLLNSFNINPFRCRYTPSCSQYAEQVIKEWGAYKGTFMALKRIMRCNPYGGFGYDPVPKKK
ncbi:MAG: membrane protein insertion efficiency factor YidD [Nanoarchaeota archaeon]